VPPCPVAVGPVTPAGLPGPIYSSTTASGAVVKPPPQMTSNGYVAVTPRPPSQAAIPATLVPQVSDESKFSICELTARLAL